jgi:predicted transposase/invertase (TIGR01784 family)
MKHPIDPQVDCVFKALLGAEENRNLLIHFLNAILVGELPEPIVWVQILNPYNEQEFIGDKLSIVDVKAKDTHERLYQIEIQLTQYASLPARMLYTWADIYTQQLQSGRDYRTLRPTYGIWLVAEDLIRGNPGYAHVYKLRDTQGRTLIEHGGIWVLELGKFTVQRVESEDQRWLRFLKEGDHLDEQALPDWMNTPEMRQAMSTLKGFSEKDRRYHAYQARQNFLREQRTIPGELEEAAREREQALRERDAALQAESAAMQAAEAALQREQEAQQERDAALAELERLRALTRGR